MEGRLEDSSPAHILWPMLEAMATPARESRRLAPAIRDDLISLLCGKVPLSVRELAMLLNRTEAYTGDAIRPLVETGRLSFLFPSQPRHPRQRYLAVGSEAELIAAQMSDGEPERSEPTGVAVEPPPVAVVDPDLTAKEELASRIWPELERIAAPGREHRRLAPNVRDALVVALCARAPLSARELGTLLGRSEAYVSDAIQPLVKSGKLGFLHADQPRHPRQKYVSVATTALSAQQLPGSDAAPQPPRSEPLADITTPASETLLTLAQARWADLEQVAKPARENRYLGGPEFAELLAAVVALAPASPRELAILTDRREEQIRQVVDGMVEQGRLRTIRDPGSPTRLKYMAVSGVPTATPIAGATVTPAPPSSGGPLPDRPPAPGAIPDKPRPPDRLQVAPAVPRSTIPVRPLRPTASTASSPAVPQPSQAQAANLDPEADSPPIAAAPTRPRPRLRPSLLNARTNPVVAIAAGIALGLIQPAGWVVYALIVAAFLAGLHVMTDSVQYQRFRHLNPSRGRLLEFLVLKAIVASGEITALYYLTHAIAG